MNNVSKSFEDVYNVQTKRIAELEAENARLRETLKDIATRKPYNCCCYERTDTSQETGKECADIARAALENVSKNEGRIGDDE